MLLSEARARGETEAGVKAGGEDPVETEAETEAETEERRLVVKESVTNTLLGK